MKRLISVVVAVLFFAGCFPPPEPPPVQMICETYYEGGHCTDGSYIDICIAEDMSRCGYEVKGRFYACDLCDPLICDDAAYAAVCSCYGICGYGASDLKVLDSNDIDYIVERANELKQALESMK